MPEGTGWVIDGFPNTYQQVKLLEKALSGADIPAEDAEGDKKISKKSKSKAALAPDPNQPPPKPEQRSSINLFVRFDLSDDLCLKRSAGRSCK